MAPAQFQDHYAILQVTLTTSHDNIKKAYHRLALQHHPDKNNGNHHATELFKRVI
jgi:molecular chaperone DnaJ